MSGFEELSALPEVQNLFAINNNQMVATTDSCLWLFDVTKNILEKIIDYPSSFDSLVSNCVTIDKEGLELYALSAEGSEIMTVDLNTRDATISSIHYVFSRSTRKKPQIVIPFSNLVMVNGILHLIVAKYAANSPTIHYFQMVFDQNTNTFKQICQVPKHAILSGVIYVACKQTVLIFGGITGMGMGTVAWACAWALSGVKWKQMKVKTPTSKPMCFRSTSQYVLSDADGGILIMLSDHEDCDDLLLLNVRTNEFRRAEMVYPNGFVPHAIAIMPNQIESELISNGYVRQQSAHVLDLECVQLIALYIGIEYLHLLARGSHWRISVSGIIERSKPINKKRKSNHNKPSSKRRKLF
eukprot:46874_1